ncbi:hypothetical protein [Rossellomorea aquimaris]|uniref:hypothetical protein n=1 Tax=Rossellomorea aquimaris TaxID=189382 RepID=UPI00114D44BE|nr:hypothetical protein [Rossellomorea aquimaris]
MIQETNFRHTEDLRIYLWILTHSKEEAGYEGERFLEKGQYIASLGNLRDYLWFYSGNKVDRYSVSRIQLSIKRLERYGWIQAEKMPHGKGDRGTGPSSLSKDWTIILGQGTCPPVP